MSKKNRIRRPRHQAAWISNHRWLEQLESRCLLNADNLAPAPNQPTIEAGTAAPFSGAVADLTDTNNPGQTIANLTATVNWGDGTATFGTVSKDPVTGDFIVSGQHLYAAVGSYQVNAKLEDVPPGTDFNFVDNTATVIANSAVVDAQALLLGEQAMFTGQVATIVEPGATFPANSFAATINWGDGVSDTGTVSGSNGSYSISGSHTYAEDGHFTVTVTAAGTGANITPAVSGTSIADVAEDDLTVTALPIQAGENNLFSGPIATFTDPSAKAGDAFTASINWGDGTSSAGTIAGAAGSYTVNGSHTYAEDGSYPVSVLVTENGVSQLLTTTLNGAQTPDNSLGTGTGTLFLSADQTTLTMSSTFSGLSGNATGAHLHNAPAGLNGPIATDVNGNNIAFANVPLATSGTLGPQSFTVNPAFVTQLFRGNIYENIHTTTNPGGEIRGQFLSSNFAVGTATVAEDDIAVTALPVNAAEGKSFTGPVATITDPGAVQTFSTVPGNGDVNPYGVAIVPAGFPSTGVLQPGDTLIANFNNANNSQGTGTTIVRITPSGQESTFFTSSAVGLDTGLVVLKSGFVIVANVPNNGANGLNPGSLQVLDANGKLVETISNPLLADPWDLAVNDQGSTAQLFVSNVSGTTGANGTVTRVDLTMSPLPVGIPRVQDIVQIGSGYHTELSPGAFVVGPGGMAYDATTGTLYVASQAEEVGGAEVGTIFSIANANTTLIDNGKGTVVFADPLHLHGPIGLVLAPNGDLITANSDAVHSIGMQPSELVEFTKTGQFVGQFSVDPHIGGAFGLAIGTVAGQYRLAAVDDNVPNVSFYDFQPTSPTVNTFSANVNWGDGTLTAGTITYGNGTFTVSGSHTYAEDGSNTFTVTATENGVTQLGAPASATAVATVAEDDITVTASAISIGENKPFTGTVATFSDPSATAGDTFTATINWGDGTPASPGVVSGSNGSYTVAASHVYAEDGRYAMTVTATENGVAQQGLAASATAAASVAEDDIVVTALPITIAEKQAFNGNVATFTDPSATVTDTFSAEILWGDNTNSIATVSGSGGQYTVSGAHTYADDGSYPVNVIVTENGVANMAPATSAMLFLAQLSGAQQVPPVATPATGIGALRLSANQTTITLDTSFAGLSGIPTAAHLHNAPAGANGPVATDANGHPIEFANLPAVTSGTLAEQSFTVSPDFVTQLLAGNIYENIHTAANPQFQVSGEIRGQLSLVAYANAAATATVLETDATISALSVFVGESQAFSGTLGVLNDPGSTEPASAFLATVDWGDGTVGAATLTGAAGVYTISGSHSYADEGHFTVKLTASENGVSPNPIATATTTADVAEDDLTVTALPISIGEHNQFSGAVATFTDPGATAGDSFTATINWGDTTLTAGVVSGSSGQFTVTGSHTYSDDGKYPVSVLVTENGVSQMLTANLNNAQQVPPNTPIPSGATGTATLFLGADQATLTVQSSYRDLTLPPTAAHLHNAPAGQNGPVAKDANGNNIEFTGVPATTSGTIPQQSYTVNAAFVSQLFQGNIYQNIHDLVFPAGEIRGQFLSSNFAASTADVAEDDITVTAQPITIGEQKPFSGAVATFTDPSATAADKFAATISWGDGGATTLGTVAGSSGQYTVTGSHTYADDGSYTVTVTATENNVTQQGPAASATASATVLENDATLTAQSLLVGEGQQFNGPLGVLSDPGSTDPASAFNVTVDWGDGTVGPAILSGTNGTYTITGGHTYVEDGHYTIHLTASEDGASPNPIATATSTADVAEDDLTVTALPITVGEHNQFSGAVATFSDPTATAGDTFTATIQWGDITSSAGVVSGSAGQFTVTGTHTYADDGNYPVSVLVTENGVSQMFTANLNNAQQVPPNIPTPSAATGTATLFLSADQATLTVQSSYRALTLPPTSAHLHNAPAGQNGPVAKDANGNDLQFAALPPTTSGVFGPQSFTVNAAFVTQLLDGNIYENIHDPAFPAGEIRGQFNPSNFATGTAVVQENDATLTGQTILAAEKQAFSGQVAVLSDLGSTDPASAFQVTIDWGDGTVGAGTVSGANGAYTVTGNHTYADDGHYPIHLTASETGVTPNPIATAAGTADVAESDLAVQLLSPALTEGKLFTGAVATFSDPSATAGDTFNATIDWGDNTTTTGTVSGSAGSYTVSGSHMYVDEGNYTVSAAVTENGVNRYTTANSATATFSVAEGDTIAASSIAGLAFPLGTSFGNILATFTDSTYPTNPPNDFTTTVNWGDGTSSTGTITALGNGSYMVTGNHAYATTGNFVATVTISDPGGTASASVNDAILVPTLAALLEPCDFNPATGLPSQGMQQLAVFGTPNDDHIQINLNKNPQGQLTYSVTIDSGSGRDHVHFQVNNVVVQGSLCKLVVFGLNGNDTIQVQSDNTNTPEWIFGGTGNDSISVDDGNDVVVGGGGNNNLHGDDGRDLLIGGSGPSSITGAKQDSILIGGTTNFQYDSFSLAQVMAEWSSADPFATRMAKLGAYLNANTVQQVAGGDTVHSGNGNDWIFNNGKIFTTDTAEDVTHDPLVGMPATIAATSGAVFSGAVATFTASDPTAVPIDFEAVIDWGNGNVSIGTVTASGGGFVVSGTNTYAAAGSDTVQVSIESLSGDSTSVTATATVSAPPTAPPLTPLQAFVTAAFQDILGRAVEPTALTYFVNALQNGETHLQFALGLTESDEYLDDEISAAYQHFLGRAADGQGLGYWLGQLRGGMTLEMMQAQFIGSPEYYQHSGGTDKAWVDHMYFDLLGRAPDSQGEGYWIGVLADGGSRALVALGFAASAEREGIIVSNDYEMFLHRAPGQPEVDGWVNAFETGMSNETVVGSIIASDEYFARFGRS